MKRITLILALGALPASIVWGQTTNAPAILTLAEAEKIALKYHPEIAQANYLTLAAQEAVTETRSGFFPTANVYADAVGAKEEQTRITAGGTLSNPGIFDRGAGGVVVNQLITDFGRTANLTASSKYQAKAESQTANQTREQVLLQADVSFFNALEAQAVLRVAKQTLDTRQVLLDQITALATNKLRSELDVSFAQVEVQQARLLVENSQNDADAAMATLSTALGYSEFHQFQLVDQAPQTNVTSDVSGLVQTALALRPELLSLRNDREASVHFARAQRDSRLPTVNAVGAAGLTPFRNENELPYDYAVGGVQMSLPIFAGGYYVAKQREAELRAQADDKLLQTVENNVIRDVRIAWLDLNDALEQLRTTEELEANAAEAFTLAEARYQTGISSIVELSDAQLNLTSAQIAEANARYNILIQEANLNYQIGLIQ